MKRSLLAAALICVSLPAWAQDVEAPQADAENAPTDTAVPATIEDDAAEAAEDRLPDPSTLTMPDLAFEATDRDIGDYEKYFYFHRDDTSFSEAFADISECDALASGVSYYSRSTEPYPGYYATQYGIGGVIGGVIGAALADAIHGSAARRKARRINMRNCMGFKGYSRYGLAKDLWQEFNFEEGNGRKPEEERRAALLQQALVASGPKPEAEELGI